MENAPFHKDLAEGPEVGGAYWIQTSDGVRVRAGYWPGGDKGTVLLFPGRTEYVEKYGPAAQELLARGYATLTIDWRGQGLADRLIENPILGHVDKFDNYQLDIAALLELAKQLDCPKPYYLIGHSMGGCIGLRALHEGLPVKASVFSSPMWGMSMGTLQRPLAWVASWATHGTKLGQLLTPGTKAESYVLAAPFQDNLLTADEDMYDFMRRHVTQVPDLQLGGPTLNWLYEALVETRKLRRKEPPDMQAITFLGGNERIVDTASVEKVIERWRNARLRLVPGAEHEIMMENPASRRLFFDEADALFSENAT